MNTISLAARYLARRKSRTTLILIVFLAINIMTFGSISIREAAKDALANLEQNAELSPSELSANRIYVDYGTALALGDPCGHEKHGV